ncbi:hypothetical protein EDF87_10427 [Pseudomonas helmanticensis]|uniref:Alpha-tubulin suppressor-like RCC1 family protein n=1 Tax=Pseudomonas helmanticensis TaxID=1471381 RepID=A0A4V3FSZ7_9PSED|nr:hypothetical protein [Pseudomonas helmanticensis]TDV49381.1 hypothetical protein EDF87_10427 [Pseudomonas helmanticensis]
MSTTAPQALKSLYIPAMTTLKPTEHYAGGIPIRAVENGLQIIVPAWYSMDLGHKVEVFCFGTVLSKTLEHASELNRDVVFTLAKGFVVDGDAADIYYKITIKNQVPEESKPRWTLLVKLTRPGEYDDIGGDDGHSDFNFTLDRYVVDDKFMPNDVVTMRIVTYRNLTKYDRIRCRWGSQEVVHDVTPEQALDPLNHPIDIFFNYNLIKAAGDGSAVAVAFQVVDRCGNYPDERAPWSALQRVVVDMNGDRLDSPLVLVKGQPTDRVDLDTLGDDDVIVRVYTTAKDFTVKDEVLLTWTGTPAQGPQIIVGPLSKTVDFVPFQLDFIIPNEAVRAIAKGSASVGFIRRREGESDRPSKNASVSVVGDISQLLAPTVDEAPGGTLPVDTPWATVSAPWYVGRNGSDLLNVIWEAKAPGGDPVYYEDPRPVGNVAEGEPVLRNVSKTEIQRFDGLSVKVYYVVTNRDNLLLSVRESLPFIMQVGVAKPTFDRPEVVEADDNDVLDPDNVPPTGATLVLTHTGTQDKDRFNFNWKGSASGGSFSDHIDLIPVTAGKPVRVTVPKQYVTANRDGTVTADYKIERGGETLGYSQELKLRIGVVEFKLPVATFSEATGAQKDQLNPDDIYPNGATVVIAATALLKEDDEITVTVEGKTTTTHPHKVLWAEAGKELTSIKIPHARIEAEDGGEIALSYKVDRKAGGTDGPSDPTVYDVRKVVVKDKLKVLGARLNHNRYEAFGTTRILSAFSDTDQPIEAEWKYSSDIDWKTASTWSDDSPNEPLHVRTADAQLTLNPVNITANGSAILAQRDEGDLVGWGKAESGANIPPHIALLKDIVGVSATNADFAIRRADGEVLAWGGGGGGDMGNTNPFGFTEVIGNLAAFAGLKGTGAITTWGSEDSGGTLPAPISALTDIVRLFSNTWNFAALRANGKVVAWGRTQPGGGMPPEIGDLTDIATLLGNNVDFAGLRNHGQLVSWSIESNGGELPQAIADLTDVIELSASSAKAFTAKRITGQLVAWGSESFGGTIDPVIAELKDIVEVSSTANAFAARRTNGRVMAWGSELNGGKIPPEIALMDDIVQVCGSSLAFAALRKNGTVVAWGNANYGGDVSPLADQLVKVQALYSGHASFIALTADGRVVTWGDPRFGGDSSAVQDRLRGQVSYLASPVSRGLALKARRFKEGGR